MSRRRGLLWVSLALLVVASTPVLPARQSSQVPPALLGAMKWRPIGPMRASRTRSGAGHPSRPFTFYAGVCNGGVWKTTDAGRTWLPIFDDQPTQSIGALVVAPSNPDILYVGSGEGLHRPDLSVGDGMYRSNDAGKTWVHLGLRDAQQIASIAVDPRDPNRLFVAALGHPYGPNPERGIYRSTDGGQTFQQVLKKDDNTGGNDVDIDPANPNVVYANLWEERHGPWENSTWSAPGGGLFKSTDGGNTWRQLTQGLPANANQANLAIAPSNPSRIYAMVATTAGGGAGGGRGAAAGAGAAGRGGAAPGAPPGGGGGAATAMYRSDDAGETWTQVNQQSGPAARIGGGDLPVPVVHPRNPDIVISASTVSWKSVDAGRNWVPFKGAPGGEDYQGGWINPDNPDIVLMVADQGAVVSLNGGETWSSWYNQPTAQMYHVAADHNFPYRLCSGQQESGSACVASRGNYGAISDRDWLPVGVDEYGYVAPDPLNPHLVYGGRNVTRFDWRTGQVSTVGPTGGRGGGATAGLTFRQVRTHPVVFSEADPRALYFGNNYLWKTIDGGLSWKRISDDPTRKTHEIPKTIGKYSDQAQVDNNGARVIYTIGPSPIDPHTVWIGTDDGVIQVTNDGGLKWRDATPAQIGSYWKVFMVDAGRFDRQTAYAAVNTLRLDDMRPHIYRTRDGGKTWTEIVNGMSDAGPANAVREDPRRKGLLYASTEKGVYVSFDDGEQWQSLRLNLPASSARDIIVKDDDLAVALHGRGFWILDDITPLRQLDARTLDQEAALFAPTPAWRVRWNTSTDMPWPKEEPTMPNPPEGTPINYYLKTAATGPVTIEILTTDNRLVRRYSSADPMTPIPEAASAPVPLYWYRAPQAVATSPGLHRFHWDVHYQPLGGAGGGRGGLPIQAIPYNTASGAGTPWVAPGKYTVKLTVNGKSYTQPITVKPDPRVKTPALVMQQVYALTRAMYFGAADAQTAQQELQRLRDQVAALQPSASGATKAALEAFAKKVELLAGAQPQAGGGRGAGGGGGRGAGAPAAAAPETLGGLAGTLSGLMNSLNAADVQPTANQLSALTAAQAQAARVMARWSALKSVDLVALNAALKAAGLAPVK